MEKFSLFSSFLPSGGQDAADGLDGTVGDVGRDDRLDGTAGVGHDGGLDGTAGGVGYEETDGGLGGQPFYPNEAYPSGFKADGRADDNAAGHDGGAVRQADAVRALSELLKQEVPFFTQNPPVERQSEPAAEEGGTAADGTKAPDPAAMLNVLRRHDAAAERIRRDRAPTDNKEKK